MKIFFAYIFLTFLALFLQSVFFRSFFGEAAVPDFLLLLVITLAVREKNIFALIIAFSLGLLGDFSSGQYLGPQAAGCVLAYLFASQVAEKIYVERGLSLFLLTLTCSLIKSSTFLFLIGIYHEIDFLSLNYFLKILLVSFITALFAPLVFKLIGSFGFSKSARSSWSSGTSPSLLSAGKVILKVSLINLKAPTYRSPF